MNTVAKKRYQIALSFADEDRAYVHKVAELLRRRGIRVFYDLYEQANLWGKNLYVHLRSVYKDESDFTVMFISEHYAKKLWTNHERESAQARAFEENSVYILPARFDDTEIPGILSTTGYVDLRKMSPGKLVELIQEKMGESKDLWKNEAIEAAEYVYRHHFEAHRGAILWCPQVSAVFANDGSGLEKSYVVSLAGKLNDYGFEVLGVGKVENNYTWAMLIASEKARLLHDLIWDCFAEIAKDDIDGWRVNALRSEAQHRLYSYWKSPHKDFCDPPRPSSRIAVSPTGRPLRRKSALKKRRRRKETTGETDEAQT